MKTPLVHTFLNSRGEGGGSEIGHDCVRGYIFRPFFFGRPDNQEMNLNRLLHPLQRVVDAARLLAILIEGNKTETDAQLWQSSWRSSANIQEQQVFSDYYAPARN